MYSEEADFTDARALRKKAEELLKEKQKKDDMLAMEADAKKLMHELQVHQIELEMQNEELRQAYETAETALKKYTMLYDLAPMGYMTLKNDGTISELNFTAAEILGERRFSLVDSNFKLFVSEDSLPDFNRFFIKVFSSNSKESCELKLVSDNDSVLLVYVEGIVIDDNEIDCLLSIVDISKFKSQT